jgi:disulfide bond formation protein DsbB
MGNQLKYLYNLNGIIRVIAFSYFANELRKQKIWALLALCLACLGAAGSMYLSMGMSLKACPLCFYQRCALFAIVSILVLGWFIDNHRMDLYCLLTFPLHIMGFGIAAFHSWLVYHSILECPKGLFGLGTAPYQSLVLFILLTVPLLAGAWPAARLSRSGSLPTWLIILLLGGVLVYLCKAGSPPLPEPPVKPYENPADTCRRPFTAKSE